MRREGVRRIFTAFGALALTFGLGWFLSFVSGGAEGSRPDRAPAFRVDAPMAVADRNDEREAFENGTYLNGEGDRIDENAPTLLTTDVIPTVDLASATFSNEAVALVETGDAHSADAYDWGVSRIDPTWNRETELPNYAYPKFEAVGANVWESDARIVASAEDESVYGMLNDLQVETMTDENGKPVYCPSERSAIAARANTVSAAEFADPVRVASVPTLDEVERESRVAAAVAAIDASQLESNSIISTSGYLPAVPQVGLAPGAAQGAGSARAIVY